jgi:pimeloyl-ACP methyl ester carboxylesterase
MPTIETPLATIEYDERGEGLPLVLLPSGAHDRHDYDELRARLPSGIRSIAMDWPGHGGSSAPRSPAGVLQFAEVVESFVRQVCPNGAVVLGNSVGGFAATRLAITNPELVHGLVIVDGGGFLGRPLSVRVFCWAMRHPGFLRRIYPSFSKRYMRCRTDADRRSMAIGIETTRADPGLRTVAQLWGTFSSPDHDLRETAPSISAPTLIIWGSRDPVIPVKAGRLVHRLIPGSELAILETGHVPHTSDPDGCAAVLNLFLTSRCATPR